MMAWLVSRSIALACVLFVASLPVAKTQAGAVLRRWAEFFLLVAITPSFCFGIAHEVAPGGDAGLSRVASAVGSVHLVVLVSAGAYVALTLRRRARPASEPRRIDMKQPFTPRRRDDDFLAILREQLERDDG